MAGKDNNSAAEQIFVGTIVRGSHGNFTPMKERGGDTNVFSDDVDMITHFKHYHNDFITSCNGKTRIFSTLHTPGQLHTIIYGMS
ncbi:MAG: hypothetical protein ACRDL7_09660 [Gaiellaceae bacterium]